MFLWGTSEGTYPQPLSFELFHKSRWWQWSWFMTFYKLGASNHLEKPKSSPFSHCTGLESEQNQVEIFNFNLSITDGRGISPTNWVDFPNKLRDVAWRISKRCDEGGTEQGAGPRWIRNFKTQNVHGRELVWNWEIFKVFYHDCLSLHLKLTKVWWWCCPDSSKFAKVGMSRGKGCVRPRKNLTCDWQVHGIAHQYARGVNLSIRMASNWRVNVTFISKFSFNLRPISARWLFRENIIPLL